MGRSYIVLKQRSLSRESDPSPWPSSVLRKSHVLETASTFLHPMKVCRCLCGREDVLQVHVTPRCGVRQPCIGIFWICNSRILALVRLCASCAVCGDAV